LELERKFDAASVLESDGVAPKLPELGRHEINHQASSSRRTSATGIQCSQNLAAPMVHSATSLGPGRINTHTYTVSHHFSNKPGLASCPFDSQSSNFYPFYFYHRVL